MESASIRTLITAALLFFWAEAASAQAYPARPVRVIVPYAPGGGADFVTRVFGKAWSESLGQQFFVDNRAGANGNIGSELAAKSKPDGYTLLSVACLAMPEMLVEIEEEAIIETNRLRLPKGAVSR